MHVIGGCTQDVHHGDPEDARGFEAGADHGPREDRSHSWGVINPFPMGRTGELSLSSSESLNFNLTMVSAALDPASTRSPEVLFGL